MRVCPCLTPRIPRIFLSYSRANSDYAATTRQRIEAEGLALWQDISHMEGGPQWWEQIRERLENPAMPPCVQDEHFIDLENPDQFNMTAPCVCGMA